jgi:hypothetical protein
MQCACTVFSYVVCPALQCFSTLCHKRHDFRQKILNIKYVFLFTLQLLSEPFFIIRRTERDVIKMYIGLRVKLRYSCQIVMKLEFSRHISENTQITNFMTVRAVRAELFHAKRRTDGQT